MCIINGNINEMINDCVILLLLICNINENDIENIINNELILMMM